MRFYPVAYKGTHKVPFGCKTVSEELSGMLEQFSIIATSLVELVELIEVLLVTSTLRKASLHFEEKDHKRTLPGKYFVSEL